MTQDQLFTTTEGADKASAVREYARQTCGSLDLHRHWTRALVYTDGIEFLAETCGAYWLIDAVASHQPAIAKRHPYEAGFQVWRLVRVWKRDDAWRLEAWSDTPDESTLLARQEIPYSDFPPGLSGFEWWVEYETMMLKEER